MNIQRYGSPTDLIALSDGDVESRLPSPRPRSPGLALEQDTGISSHYYSQAQDLQIIAFNANNSESSQGNWMAFPPARDTPTPSQSASHQDQVSDALDSASRERPIENGSLSVATHEIQPKPAQTPVKPSRPSQIIHHSRGVLTPSVPEPSQSTQFSSGLPNGTNSIALPQALRLQTEPSNPNGLPYYKATAAAASPDHRAEASHMPLVGDIIQGPTAQEIRQQQIRGKVTQWQENMVPQNTAPIASTYRHNLREYEIKIERLHELERSLGDKAENPHRTASLPSYICRRCNSIFHSKDELFIKHLKTCRTNQYQGQQRFSSQSASVLRGQNNGSSSYNNNNSTANHGPDRERDDRGMPNTSTTNALVIRRPRFAGQPRQQAADFIRGRTNENAIVYGPSNPAWIHPPAGLYGPSQADSHPPSFSTPAVATAVTATSGQEWGRKFSSPAANPPRTSPAVPALSKSHSAEPSPTQTAQPARAPYRDPFMASRLQSTTPIQQSAQVNDLISAQTNGPGVFPSTNLATSSGRTVSESGIMPSATTFPRSSNQAPTLPPKVPGSPPSIFNRPSDEIAAVFDPPAFDSNTQRTQLPQQGYQEGINRRYNKENVSAAAYREPVVSRTPSAQGQDEEHVCHRGCPEHDHKFREMMADAEQYERDDRDGVNIVSYRDGHGGRGRGGNTGHRVDSHNTGHRGNFGRGRSNYRGCGNDGGRGRGRRDAERGRGGRGRGDDGGGRGRGVDRGRGRRGGLGHRGDHGRGQTQGFQDPFSIFE